MHSVIENKEFIQGAVNVKLSYFQKKGLGP